MSQVEKRLQDMGVVLPACPAPIAAYVPAKVVGGFIYVSGQTPMMDGELKYKGSVGGSVSVEDGYAAARLCTVRIISALKSVAELDKLEIVKVTGYVNSVEGFGEQPQVINGASDLLEAAFLEHGKHARAALGVSGLPGGASVEVELIAALR